MANDRKRREAKRNRMREQRAASEARQPEILPGNSQDRQASCSTGKRRRLDSSAASSISVQSNT